MASSFIYYRMMTIYIRSPLAKSTQVGPTKTSISHDYFSPMKWAVALTRRGGVGYLWSILRAFGRVFPVLYWLSCESYFRIV